VLSGKTVADQPAVGARLPLNEKKNANFNRERFRIDPIIVFLNGSKACRRASILVSIVCGLNCCMSDSVHAEDTRRIGIDDSLAFTQKPIDYHGSETADPVAVFQKRLDSKQVKLHHHEHFGFLLSVLHALHVPLETQVLVYSKTARNPRLVRPKTPRAIFFNDDVAVGWVPGATELEVVGIDSVKGGMFYTLSQTTADDGSDHRFERSSRCLSCHRGNTTHHVPGLIVRSFVTDRIGKPISGFSRVTHDMDLSKRFGGWYVTGKPSGQKHRGNLIDKADIARHKRDPSHRGTLEDLQPLFDVSRYPSPHSDIVAQLVLQHQAHGQNLLMRVGYESRLGRRSDAEDRLIRYLLFLDEAPLAEPVRGTSGFAEWFEKQKPFEHNCYGVHAHRSLRQFDLETRLFKFRFSYLVYSRLFDGLPEEVRNRLYKRIWTALNGNDDSLDLETFPKSERRAIIEIVRATKCNLPDYWRDDLH